MGKSEIILVVAVIIIILGITAIVLYAPRSMYSIKEYDPVPGNDTCWLSLCVKEEGSTDCIRFPLGYEDCGELEYACNLNILRDMQYPDSSVWFESLGFDSCTYSNQTCYCVMEAGTCAI